MALVAVPGPEVEPVVVVLGEVLQLPLLVVGDSDAGLGVFDPELGSGLVGRLLAQLLLDLLV